VEQCCLGSKHGDSGLIRARDLGAEEVVATHSGPKVFSEGPLSRSRLLNPHDEHRFKDYYEIGRKLGEGSFGDVYQAHLRPVDAETGRPLTEGKEPSFTQLPDGAGGGVGDGGSEGSEGDAAGGGAAAASGDDKDRNRRRVAVKVFQLVPPAEKEMATPRTAALDVKRIASFEAERIMLASLEHPHIVRMYECFQQPHVLYIVLEQCHGGELYTRLVNTSRKNGGGGFDEPLGRTLFRQMLHPVGYLHSKRIVHRDIKTENFLLLGEVGTPEANVLKLCDFGTAVVLTDRRPRSMENIGTLSYTAPEVYMQRGAVCAADCWSLGVVLYVLLTGTNPFRSAGSTTREDTVRRIRAGNFDRRRSAWMRLSELAQDLVREFLVLEESQRLSCNEALGSAWYLAEDRCADKSSTNVESLALHVPKLWALLLRLPHMAQAQKLALASCALAMTEADLTGLGMPWRDLFLTLDEDQDGRLSFRELGVGIRRLLGRASERVSDEQLMACVHAMDLDNSGAIEWVEFLAVALLGSQSASQAHGALSTAHRLLDRPETYMLLDADGFSQQAGPIISRWAPVVHYKAEEVDASHVAREDEQGTPPVAAATEAAAAEADDGAAAPSPVPLSARGSPVEPPIATRTPLPEEKIRRLSLGDLRLVLGSTEVFEML